MELIFNPSVSRFEFVCAKHERQVPKDAGFRFDWNTNTWYTNSALNAKRVSHYASPETQQTIQSLEQAEKPSLTLTQNTYVWKSSIEYKDLPKKAGFKWDATNKVWNTPDWKKAIKLVDYMTPETKAHVEAEQAKYTASLSLSRAAASTLNIPAPAGLDYLPYQKAGIEYGMNRDAVLIADEMGLGKTIQAIGIINASFNVRKVLVICPASLRLNWKREMEKWLVTKRTIGIVNTKQHVDCLPDTDIVICNYDIAHKYKQQLDSVQWDVLVADEAHYLKNPKAKRTQAIVGDDNALQPLKAHKRIILTGTPIPNRVKEIWPVLHYLDSVTWNSFPSFGIRYCAGHKTSFGWDFSGASYLAELQDKLRSTVMIRRLKKDVLKELPDKIRQIVHLEPNGSSTLIAKEQKLYADFENTVAKLQAEAELFKLYSEDKYTQAVKKLGEYKSVAFREMSEMRHKLALSKADSVIEFVESAIEDPAHKVVLFAHHKDVIDKFKAAFQDKAVSLTGDTPMQERQNAVDAFQNDASVQVFIGNILAAGVGLTLTASSHVVFAELDWVPGNMQQAEDRTHRIGQKNTVLVQHLVLDGSLDARMAQTLIEKQKVMDSLLDNESGYSPDLSPVQAVSQEPVFLNTALAESRQITFTTRQLDESPVSEEDKDKIHEGLCVIAAYCDGAYARDGFGFNKVDSYIGKLLAAKPLLSDREAALGKLLVTKYKRQLPENLRF